MQPENNETITRGFPQEESPTHKKALHAEIQPYLEKIEEILGRNYSFLLYVQYVGKKNLQNTDFVLTNEKNKSRVDKMINDIGKKVLEKIPIR